MVDFNTLLGIADSRIFATVGEICEVTRQPSGKVIEQVDVVLDFDVQLVLDDVSQTATTVSYSLESVGGALARGDEIRRANGDVWQLSQRVMGDEFSEVRTAVLKSKCGVD